MAVSKLLTAGVFRRITAPIGHWVLGIAWPITGTHNKNEILEGPRGYNILGANVSIYKIRAYVHSAMDLAGASRAAACGC